MGNIALAPAVAAYGRSQAGLTIRYALADGANRPHAHARVTTALQSPRDRDLALGLSARPVATIPLRAAAEVRISDTAAGSEVRPAAYAVTELPPFSLPRGWQGEAYAQAGYVGGRFATGFVDGQVRLDRKILSPSTEDAELRAGLAAWGGAQRGAARLDIGPTASLGFRLGDARSRLAVDYRFRVAGEAEPKSGPAVTLSAGF